MVAGQLFPNPVGVIKLFAVQMYSSEFSSYVYTNPLPSLSASVMPSQSMSESPVSIFPLLSSRKSWIGSADCDVAGRNFPRNHESWRTAVQTWVLSEKMVDCKAREKYDWSLQKEFGEIRRSKRGFCRTWCPERPLRNLIWGIPVVTTVSTRSESRSVAFAGHGSRRARFGIKYGESRFKGESSGGLDSQLRYGKYWIIRSTGGTPCERYLFAS